MIEALMMKSFNQSKNHHAAEYKWFIVMNMIITNQKIAALSVFELFWEAFNEQFMGRM